MNGYPGEHAGGVCALISGCPARNSNVAAAWSYQRVNIWNESLP
jgi:hypothetical protein